MKKIIIFLFCLKTLFAADQTYECNQIFNQRKNELDLKIEKIDEASQAYDALRAATNALLDKKKIVLEKKEKEINATLIQIKQKESNIKNMLQENKELLKAIKKAKDDKISETYSKMRASAAAQILSSMKANEAAKILFNLEANKISKIMAKMAPQEASKITNILLKGPPF